VLCLSSFVLWSNKNNTYSKQQTHTHTHKRVLQENSKRRTPRSDDIRDISTTRRKKYPWLLMSTVASLLWYFVGSRQQHRLENFQWTALNFETLQSVSNALLTSRRDATIDKLSFNYSTKAVPTEFTLPPPIRTNETTVVITLSSRSNFNERHAIRESWARIHNSVYFVIGGPEAGNMEDVNVTNPLSVTSLIRKEQELYRDIIDSIHPDSNRSLPYKLHFAMTWVVHNLPQVKWVVKSDDDQIVRLQRLQFLSYGSIVLTIPVSLEALLRRCNPNGRASGPKILSFKTRPIRRGHLVLRAISSVVKLPNILGIKKRSIMIKKKTSAWVSGWRNPTYKSPGSICRKSPKTKFAIIDSASLGTN